MRVAIGAISSHELDGIVCRVYAQVMQGSWHI